MKRNTPKTLAVACSLALVVSTLSASAWARGSSGGHSSSGMSHNSGRSMSTSSNFTRTTHTNFTQHVNGVNHVNRFKSNTNSHFPNGGKFKNGFIGNKNQFQKFSMKNFSKSKSPFWKKYCGWGKFSGPWGYDFGWGWGCWDSPCCYGWCYYEPVPVVAYYNPYCDCAGTVVDGVDYSVPIANIPSNTVDSDDSDSFAAARAAFAQGDLDGALKAISVAVLQTPHNQNVHQFHSLVLFAANSYCKSATVAHAVLEEGPGWTWDTVQTFYASPEVYTEQLRRLEHFVSEHPSDANVRFLLGYHYMMLNHADSAQRQLGQVVELEPKDKLASNILAGIKTATPTKIVPAQTVPEQTAPVKAAAVKTDLAKTDTVKTDLVKTEVVKTETVKMETIKQATPKATSDDDEDQSTADSTPVVNRELVAEANVAESSSSPLMGTWKASPAKGVQIELTLRSDKTFTWKFTANGKKQDFSGKYELGDKSLVLSRNDGESMEGTLEREGDASFKFRMKDADSDDPGLSFAR